MAILIALVYVPGHNPSATGSDHLFATIAELYAVGLSVVGVRLVRGMIVRAGGSREPIVLLGRGPDPLVSELIRPGWRLAAVLAGAIEPVGVAVVAVRFGGTVAPGTSAHAIASIALLANAAIAVGALVPAPGFAGWALLLGIVDAAGSRPAQRVRRATRLAQLVGLLVILGSGMGTALLGDLMPMAFGLVFAFVIWSGSQAADTHDRVTRFLTMHEAGEVARPLVARAGPDEPVVNLVARLRTDRAVVAVEAGGGVLGAIGPRQLTARVARGRSERCVQAMVPLGSIQLLHPDSPAIELIPEIARNGFALIIGPDGLGYVDGEELWRQVRVWNALGDLRSTRPADSATGSS